MRAYVHVKYVNKVLGLLLLLLAQCSPQPQPPVVLDGEWIFINPNPGSRGYAGLEFDKGEYYWTTVLGRFLVGPYSVNGDTLKVMDERRAVVYKILKSTSDTLVIFDDGVAKTYYNKALDYNAGLQLNGIVLEMGGCDPKCPEFEFTVSQGDSTAQFVGGVNAKTKGRKTVGLSYREWQKLDSLFKWSNIRRADSSAYYGAVDDWTLTIYVAYNGHERAKVRGTEGSIFYGLKPIVHELIAKVGREKLI